MDVSVFLKSKKCYKIQGSIFRALAAKLFSITFIVDQLFSIYMHMKKYSCASSSILKKLEISFLFFYEGVSLRFS